MKILIIEDEEISFQHIKNLIRQIDKNIETEGPLTSIEDVVDYFDKGISRPDLILSDIRLNDGEVFEGFRQVDMKIPVIFTTAFDEYAIRAFNYNSIDYLLKPIQEENLSKAISKYKNMSNVLPLALSHIEPIVRQSYRRRILCPHKNTTVIVNVDHIAYIRMEASIVKVYMNDGFTHYTTDMTLSELTEELDPNSFCRVNRQEIVNIPEIASYKVDFTRKVFLNLKAYPMIDIAVTKERFPYIKSLLERTD